MSKVIAVTSEIKTPNNIQTKRVQANVAYVDYVLAAGYQPFIVPIGVDTTAIASRSDGLLLIGGRDINPLFYNKDLTGAGWCSLERDLYERELVRAFIKADKPIFGICRGFQLLGIMAGLGLYQSIGFSKQVVVTHNQGGDDEDGPWIPGIDPTHVVKNFGLAEEIFGKNVVLVNSFHHQAFLMKNRLGWVQGQFKGKNALEFDVTVLGHSFSRDPGKVLESMFLMMGGVMVGGVQWHPERLIYRESQREEHLAPFRHVMEKNDS